MKKLFIRKIIIDYKRGTLQIVSNSIQGYIKVECDVRRNLESLDYWYGITIKNQIFDINIFISRNKKGQRFWDCTLYEVNNTKYGLEMCQLPYCKPELNMMNLPKSLKV